MLSEKSASSYLLDEEKAKGSVDEGNAEASDEVKDAEHHGEGEAAPEEDQKHKEDLDARQKQIDGLRTKLANLKEEGKDHISFYSVICDSYKVIESEDDGAAEVSEDNTEAAVEQDGTTENTEETKPE